MMPTMPSGIPTQGMMKRKMIPITMSASPAPIMGTTFPSRGATNP